MGLKSDFKDDISKWNVSNVTNMRFMFSYSTQFNGDISGWNVSSVTDMSAMFRESYFNGDISGWNISSVTNMNDIFFNCPILDEHKPWYGYEFS